MSHAASSFVPRPVFALFVMALAVVIGACDRAAPASRGTSALFLNAARGGEPRVLLVPLDTDEAIDPEVSALLDRIGVALVRTSENEVGPATGFEVLGRSFRTDADALVAVCADPRQPSHPVTLAIGGARPLAELQRDLRPGWKPSLTALRAGSPALVVDLAPSGRARTGTLREQAPRWKREAGDYRRVVDANEESLGVHTQSLRRKPVLDYVARARAAQGRLARWAPIGGPLGDSKSDDQENAGGSDDSERARQALPPLVIEVDVDGLANGRPIDATARFEALAGEGGAGVVLALLAPGLPHDDGLALMQGLLAGAIAGGDLALPAAHWFLHAAALDAAGSWFGRDLGESTLR